MSYKIYLIKHLDTDMKYVGITGGDLVKRWKEHYNDPNSNIQKVLRTDGHRMTMELLEEVATKPEALKKEQEYIRSLGTATPSGWNRRVITPAPKLKKWEKIATSFTAFWNGSQDVLSCPACGGDFTHQKHVEVYIRDTEDGGSIRHVILHAYAKTGTDTHYENPSPRRQGVRIYFTCEICHGDSELPKSFNPMPFYELLIYQHKGQTFFETVYYIEDNS